MMSSNNGGIKKMSLEEFLGDDSLGDSVWNEDDINLDAITNTTNIDLLRTRQQKQQGGGGGGSNNGELRPFEYRSPAYHNGLEGSVNNNGKFNSIPTGPPYIVKFSQLPPNFASVDIDDLFHEKFTKYSKCKMFWELNPSPSISTLNSGTIFEQNFKRDSKVAFVELITSRDMDKILKFWTQPLLKYYNIKVERAKFEDFNEYNAKVKLLTEPKDDASKPYVPPVRQKQHLRSSKSSPFGSAKPVDTQSKILEIEEKVGKLGVEDTGTLRRISRSEPNNPQQQPHQPKVTLLKKPHENSASSSAVDEGQQQPVKPLSYLQVIKKTAEENKNSPSSSSSTTKLSSPAINPTTIASNSTLPGSSTAAINSASITQSSSLPSSTSLGKGSLSPRSLEDNVLEKTEDQHQTHPRYHRRNSNNNYYSNNGTQHNYHNSGEDSSYYKRTQFSGSTINFRGRGGGTRGGSFHRGGGPRGGGVGGGNSMRSQNDGRKGGPSNHNHSSGGPSNHYSNDQQEGRNYPPEEKRYSIFKPASGFLWESGKDKSNSGHNQRGGGHFGRGSYRGGRSRRNNGFTSV